MRTCSHQTEPFGCNPFGRDREPTDMEIRNYRLWKCPKCGRWYSLLGGVKRK